MQAVKGIAAALALLALAFMAVAVGVAALDARQAIRAVGNAASGVESLTVQASSAVAETESAVREFRATALELRAVASEVRATVRKTDRRIDGTSRNLNALLIQLGLAADQWQQASREQREYWSETSRQIQGVVVEASETFKATRVVLESTDELVSDPNLRDSVESLAASSRNVDEATADLAETTEMVKRKVRQLTAPKRWFVTLGRAILSVGADVAQIFVALK